MEVPKGELCPRSDGSSWDGVSVSDDRPTANAID